MAMLIVIFGVTAAIKTPTDIFPNIGIPVVAVVWQYNGLPPDDMSGRVIYYYERYLSAQVNDIEHIESQSLPGYGVVKVFFQPGVNINGALAQITAASQTVLKLLPPGNGLLLVEFGASTEAEVLAHAEFFLAEVAKLPSRPSARLWVGTPAASRVSRSVRRWSWRTTRYGRDGSLRRSLRPDRRRSGRSRLWR